MSVRLLRIALPATLAVCAAACSGGASSDSGGSGDLQARVLWEQRDDDAAATSGVAPSGGFGLDLPASVRTVRFDFTPSSGQACCVAVDPLLIPIDPSIGQRRIVLKRLPAGSGTLRIAGFPGDRAAAPQGSSATCQIEPSSASRSCVSGLVDTPSFLSAAQAVDVVGGGVVDAGDIEVLAQPFIVPGSLEPVPGGEAVAPLRIRATVVIAVDGIRESSLAMRISPGGSLGVDAVPCDDAGGNPCSAGGDLEVNGFQVESALADPPAGAADVSVGAESTSGRPLSVTYGIDVLSGEATPTGVSTATPNQVSTATPRATQSGVPTSTPRAPTATRRPATSTPTPIATATGPTATPTPTADAMCGEQPRSSCRRSTVARASSLRLLKAGAGTDDDSLLYRWENGEFTDLTDFGDPGLTTSYAVCLYDEVGGTPVLRRQWFVPAGPDCPAVGCWIRTENGYTYSDELARRDGIERVVLTAGVSGRASIAVNGSGPNLALPSLPLTQDQHVIVQVINDHRAGECWQETFRLPAIRNNVDQFRDEGDGPVN